MEGFMSGAGTGPSVAQGLGPLGYVAPTLKQRIEMATQKAEQHLADVKRAREILDANPDLETLLNIMQRTQF